MFGPICTIFPLPLTLEHSHDVSTHTCRPWAQPICSQVAAHPLQLAYAGTNAPTLHTHAVTHFLLATTKHQPRGAHKTIVVSFHSHTRSQESPAVFSTTSLAHTHTRTLEKSYFSPDTKLQIHTHTHTRTHRRRHSKRCCCSMIFSLALADGKPVTASGGSCTHNTNTKTLNSLAATAPGCGVQQGRAQLPNWRTICGNYLMIRKITTYHDTATHRRHNAILFSSNETTETTTIGGHGQGGQIRAPARL